MQGSKEGNSIEGRSARAARSPPMPIYAQLVVTLANKMFGTPSVHGDKREQDW